MSSESAPIRILHLEDDPTDADLTAALLEDGELVCDIARTQARDEYIKLLDENEFDLILADYNLPGFDGLTALSIAREKCPQIPFLFLSGKLGEELAVETLRQGATDYVLKDSTQRLVPAVRRAIGEMNLRNREMESQLEAQRARDEAMRANEAKSRFLSRMSHELRTPLNAILGYTQLMQSDPMTEEQDHCSHQIMKAGQILLKLINELLDFGRIESGHLQFNLQPVPVLTVMQRSIDLVKPIAREANIELMVDSDRCTLGVFADEDRLTQVLINLLTNGVKYNQPRGRVYLECRSEEDHVRLQVRDTGPGIPAEKLRRLFIPFDRLDAEYSTVQGTGLGLAVSRGLIEAMGGKLEAECIEGEGSTFWLILPKADVIDDDPESLMPGGVLTGARPGEAVKVLLIEDDPTNADLMERAFRRRKNFSVQTVGTGSAALVAVQTNLPRLIVMDVHLPDTEGHELMNAFRQALGDREMPPVIVVTAEAAPDTEHRYLEMGVSSYLKKPIDITEFFKIVDRVLDHMVETEGSVLN